MKILSAIPPSIHRAIRREEWYGLLPFVGVLSLFHYLIVSKFFRLFADYSEAHWIVFNRNFHMSGFDPVTYAILTEWHQGYDLLRHPLLALAMFPLSMLNRGLWWLTGCNCCQPIMAGLLLLCSACAWLFLFRLCRNVIGLRFGDAMLLCWLFFGFAHILVAVIVPDHFALSLPVLLYVVYRAADKRQRQEAFSLRESLVLFTLASGITLSNGPVVALVIALTNGRKALSPKFIGTAFILPGMLLLGGVQGIKTVNGIHELPVESQLKDVHHDVNRLDVLVENFFGESLQLHRKDILGDVLVRRPVIVRYTWPAQYLAEGWIIGLFFMGLFAARRTSRLRIYASILLYTLLLHFVIGFGLNEVHIMACHWAYLIPIAIAEAWGNCSTRRVWGSRLSVQVLTIYLWIYHTLLLVRYLTWPLKM